MPTGGFWAMLRKLELKVLATEMGKLGFWSNEVELALHYYGSRPAQLARQLIAPCSGRAARVIRPRDQYAFILAPEPAAMDIDLEHRLMSHPMIIAITFETQAQPKGRGRFTVPARVARLLDLGPGDDVSVEVTSRAGHFGPVVKTLKSDREPSPARDMSDWMEPGERIRVVVARP